MTAKPEQPEQRDRALARLLAEELKAVAPSEVAGRAACPDAEILAAYADQGLGAGTGKGLDNDERDQLENHFAACERCQKVLAVLGAGDEIPLGESVAVAPAPATPRPAARPSSSPQRWLWWLTPAFGAAAAALLWMALRPASPAPVQTAADYSRAAGQETRSLSAPVAPATPPAAETPPEAAAPRRDVEALDRLSARAEPDAEAKQEAAQNDATAMPRATPAETAPAALGARSAVAVPQAAPLVGGVTQGVTVTEQTPPVTFANGAPRAAASSVLPPAPAPPAMTQTVTITEERPLIGGTRGDAAETPSLESLGQLPVSGRNFAQLLNLYTFSSPDGSVSWRLGAAGRIERSTDRGQIWQQQASGVATDLLAGSAGSKDVAWVVGRAGVILRTTDGQQWQRVAPPGGVTGDWATVVAHDAMNATVVAGDLRRFSTEDGGRTWTQQ